MHVGHRALQLTRVSPGRLGAGLAQQQREGCHDQSGRCPGTGPPEKPRPRRHSQVPSEVCGQFSAVGAAEWAVVPGTQNVSSMLRKRHRNNKSKDGNQPCGSRPRRRVGGAGRGAGKECRETFGNILGKMVSHLKPQRKGSHPQRGAPLHAGGPRTSAVSEAAAAPGAQGASAGLPLTAACAAPIFLALSRLWRISLGLWLHPNLWGAARLTNKSSCRPAKKQTARKMVLLRQRGPPKKYDDVERAGGSPDEAENAAGDAADGEGAPCSGHPAQRGSSQAPRCRLLHAAHLPGRLRGRGLRRWRRRAGGGSSASREGRRGRGAMIPGGGGAPARLLSLKPCFEFFADAGPARPRRGAPAATGQRRGRGIRGGGVFQGEAPCAGQKGPARPGAPRQARRLQKDVVQARSAALLPPSLFRPAPPLQRTKQTLGPPAPRQGSVQRRGGRGGGGRCRG